MRKPRVGAMAAPNAQVLRLSKADASARGCERWFALVRAALARANCVIDSMIGRRAGASAGVATLRLRWLGRAGAVHGMMSVTDDTSRARSLVGDSHAATHGPEAPVLPALCG